MTSFVMAPIYLAALPYPGVWSVAARSLSMVLGKMCIRDRNMIDPYHLEAYGVTTVNYNRDVDIFPVLNAIFEGIYGESPYKSPTDMGVNLSLIHI